MTVTVESLSMTYRVPVRPPGVREALRSLFHREFREVHAVKSISFEVGPGEMIGFIGPNGAGKTTTLKMLSGILHPTSGYVRVLGHEPKRREQSFLRQIALIRGSQPIGGPPELTVMDALRLQQLVYEVEASDFRRNLETLTSLLEIGPLLDRQVRALSLGERMRCGLALALVYGPKLLFLDEPTIGMDVSVVELTRTFLREYVDTTRATVLLTSHYMADVERLCERVILIDRGTIAYDGSLTALSTRISPYKLINLAVPDVNRIDWTRYGDVSTATDERISIRVPLRDVPLVTRAILGDHDTILDLSITEPPLEQVMDRVYREGVA
jgi:ABC-2 type transport system ATP-binding protein